MNDDSLIKLYETGERRKKVYLILKILIDSPKGSTEISRIMGIIMPTLRNVYLRKMRIDGLIDHLIPDNIYSPMNACVITEKGKLYFHQYECVYKCFKKLYTNDEYNKVVNNILNVFFNNRYSGEYSISRKIEIHRVILIQKYLPDMLDGNLICLRDEDPDKINPYRKYMITEKGKGYFQKYGNLI